MLMVKITSTQTRCCLSPNYVATKRLVWFLLQLCSSDSSTVNRGGETSSFFPNPKFTSQNRPLVAEGRFIYLFPPLVESVARLFVLDVCASLRDGGPECRPRGNGGRIKWTFSKSAMK